jgi:hypothetical protein
MKMARRWALKAHASPREPLGACTRPCEIAERNVLYVRMHTVNPSGG